MRSYLIGPLAAAIMVIPAPAAAWGKTGHRVVAAIAETQLSGLARARIAQILDPGESLEEAATWPDEMRDAPGEFWQKTANPWHYVTLNQTTYDHAPAEGDAFEALKRFTKTLQDPNATRADKQLALRFVVHIVGDLHQPLHAGKCCDHGGNDVKVSWFGKPSNIHAVWDSQLVDEEQLSYTELASKLERHISPIEIINWWNPNPLAWINESAQIRDLLYPKSAGTGANEAASKAAALPELSYSYVYQFTPVMERRLSQGGIRLAAYLDMIFAEARMSSSHLQK